MPVWFYISGQNCFETPKYSPACKRVVRMPHIAHPLCNFLTNCQSDDEEASVSFRLYLIHPEIAAAALVQLCQVVLLCKYVRFSLQKHYLPASQGLNFSGFCSVMQKRCCFSVLPQARHHFAVGYKYTARSAWWDQSFPGQPAADWSKRNLLAVWRDQRVWTPDTVSASQREPDSLDANWLLLIWIV